MARGEPPPRLSAGGDRPRAATHAIRNPGPGCYAFGARAQVRAGPHPDELARGRRIPGGGHLNRIPSRVGVALLTLGLAVSASLALEPLATHMTPPPQPPIQ